MFPSFVALKIYSSCSLQLSHLSVLLATFFFPPVDWRLQEARNCVSFGLEDCFSKVFQQMFVIICLQDMIKFTSE